VGTLILILLQHEEVIPRASKQIYHPAVLSCEKAEGLIDSDPKEAIRLLDEILGNAKVEKRECRMKIVIQPGTESKWFDFYPYQFRGRASLKLSEKAQRDDKVRHLDQAVQHFKKSAELGFKASEPMLKSATQKLEQARLTSAGGEDPEVPFRRGWTDLLDSGRFSEAKAFVGAKGTFLSDEKRAEYGAETDKRCLAAVGKAADRFVGEMARVPSVRDLADLRAEAFDRDLGVPARETLVKTSEKYEWCTRTRATLAKVRGGEEVLPEMFERAIEAIPFSEASGNAFYRAVEVLAWSALEAAVRRRADEARGAPPERRKTLRTEADGLVGQWGAFAKRATEAAQARPEAIGGVPARNPGSLLAQFPVDLSLDAVVAALDGSVTADHPERVLEETEKAIQKLLDGGERLTNESRRRILTLAVVTRSLRGLLAEEDLDDVVRGARTLASDLPQLGGPVEDVKRYGPKVGEVFKRLR